REFTMGWVSALHIIGVVLWFGSLLQVTRMLKTHANAPEGAHETLTGIERRTQLLIGIPGLVITIGMGLVLLLHGGGAKFYMKQGWFHMKLTVVLIALIVEVMLFFKIRAFAKQPGTKLAPLLMHIVAGLCLIAAVVSVKVMYHLS
ncbi:MAG: CopD family protein, partial [Planctomycetota bacterium]